MSRSAWAGQEACSIRPDHLKLITYHTQLYTVAVEREDKKKVGKKKIVREERGDKTHWATG